MKKLINDLVQKRPAKPRAAFSAAGVVLLLGLALYGTFTLDSRSIPNVQAAGTDYYVSPSGLDANPGTTQASPFKTIGKAASVVAAGDTVHVAPGTYPEVINFTTSGSAASRISYICDTKWACNIWPTVDLYFSNWPNNLVVSVSGSYTDFEGFDIAPGGTNHISTGADVSGTNDVFRHNRIHDINTTTTDTGSGLGVSGTNNVIDSNLIYHIGNDTLDHGIYVYEGSYNTIINNVIGNTAGYGISLWHIPHHVFIYNNATFNNGKSGILVGAGDHPESNATGCIVANNIGYGNTEYAIIEWGTVSNNTYVNNLGYNNGSGTINLINGTQTGTITADPQFVNYQADGTGDYHLQSTSHAINAASATYAPATDFDGTARPQGAGGNDIGAYEKSQLYR